MKKFEDYFDLEEVFCPHAIKYYKGELGYSDKRMYAMLNPRLKANWLWLRESLGRRIYINNYAIGGDLSQRGVRCALCQIVANRTTEGKPYLSAHPLGDGLDGDVEGMSAEDVRQYILDHEDEVPYPGRIEMDKSWLHWDCVDMGVKVYKLFV